MMAYTSALLNVSLAGPTLFGPVISHAALIASQSLANGGQKYFVLLIITVTITKCWLFFPFYFWYYYRWLWLIFMVCNFLISLSYVVFIFSAPLLRFFYPLKFLIPQNGCRIIFYAPDEQMLMESQLHINMYMYDFFLFSECPLLHYLKYVKTVVGWSSNGSSRNQRCACEGIWSSTVNPHYWSWRSRLQRNGGILFIFTFYTDISHYITKCYCCTLNAWLEGPLI